MSYPQFLPVPGPPGPPGKDGSDGYPGPPGPYGPPGMSGRTGNDGARGVAGPPGPCGCPGQIGPQGRIGDNGERGYQGDFGNQGFAGQVGLQGPPGTPADSGSSNFQFIVETATTLSGPPTDSLTITNGEKVRFWSAGGTELNLQAGSALLNIEPNNLIASSGNPLTSPKDPNRVSIYVNQLNGSMWAWDTDHQSWSQKTGSGAEGYQGPQGNGGTIGVNGSQGYQGSIGNQGSIGIDGPQGYQGYQGYQGTNGYQGDLGQQGYQGYQGLIGIGVAGPQGTAGDAGDVSSGSYTPATTILATTMSTPTNIDSVGAFNANWMRIANIVTVSGRLQITKAFPGTAFINLTVSLPVGLNRGSNDFISGHLTTTTPGINGIVVQYSPNDGVVEIQGFAPANSTFTNLKAHYTYSYTL